MIEPIQDPFTLADLLQDWLNVLKAENKSKSTLKNYTTGVTAYIRWCEQRGETPRIDRTLVTEWVAELLASGMEPSSAKTRRQAVRRFSAWMDGEDDLDYTDQLLGLKPPKVPEKLIEPLTEVQLRVLILACEGKTLRDKRDEAIIRLLTETGMRASEVVGLQVSDLNMASGVVTIGQAKGGRGRLVSISPKTAVAIDKYLRLRRSHPAAGLPDLWLSLRGNSARLSYMGMRYSISERATLAGIENFHLHLMRHTASSRWLAAGGSEQGLMTRHGWRDRSMLDRYTRATASERSIDEARHLGLGDL
jgi:site-specific recombinase XerD